MTPSIALAWIRSHLVAVLVVLVVVLLLVASAGWRRAHELAAEVGAARRAAELRAQGQFVPDAVSQEAIDKAAVELAARAPKLAAEVAEAKRVAPGASVIQVVDAATAPAEAHGTADVPREAKGASGAGSAPQPRKVLLYDGDRLQLRLKLITLEDDGAHLLKGTLSAVRLAPDGSEVLLLEEPIAEQLSTALEKASSAAVTRRWAVGPVVGIGRGGWLAGGLLETPSARVPLLRWDVSGVVLVGAGPEAWLLAAGGLVRW